jgi:hypothetical protein
MVEFMTFHWSRGRRLGRCGTRRGGNAVSFKDNALNFASMENVSFGKAHLDFVPEAGMAYKLSFQLSVDVKNVSKESPRVFSWYGGFGTQNQFVDYQVAVGLKLYYNSNYDRNQLKLGIGSGHHNTIKTDTVMYAIGRNIPAEWSAQIDIEWDGRVAVYSVDGQVIGSVPYSGPLGGLWFKGSAMRGIPEDLLTIRHLTVTKLEDAKRVIIPEANHFGLWLSLSAVLLVCARRR